MERCWSSLARSTADMISGSELKVGPGVGEYVVRNRKKKVDISRGLGQAGRGTCSLDANIKLSK